MKKGKLSFPVHKCYDPTKIAHSCRTNTKINAVKEMLHYEALKGGKVKNLVNIKSDIL